MKKIKFTTSELEAERNKLKFITSKLKPMTNKLKLWQVIYNLWHKLKSTRNNYQKRWTKTIFTKSNWKFDFLLLICLSKFLYTF